MLLVQGGLEDSWSQESEGGFGARIPVVRQPYPRQSIEQTSEATHPYRASGHPGLTQKQAIGDGYLERDSDRRADHPKLTEKQPVGAGYLEGVSDIRTTLAEVKRKTRKYSAVVDKWRQFNSEPFDGIPVDFDFELNLELGQNSIKNSPDLVYRKRNRKRRKKPNSDWRRLLSSSLKRPTSPTTSSSTISTTTRISPLSGVEDSSWDVAHAWQVMDRARNTQFLLALQGLDFRPPASQPATPPPVYQLAGHLATPPPVFLTPPPLSVTEAANLPFLQSVEEDTSIQTFSQQWWPASEIPPGNVGIQQSKAFESQKSAGRSRPKVYRKRRLGPGGAPGWGLVAGSSLGPSLTSSLASFLRPLWGVLGGRGAS